ILIRAPSVSSTSARTHPTLLPWFSIRVCFFPMKHRTVVILFLVCNTVPVLTLSAQSSLPDHPQPQSLPEGPKPQSSVGAPRRPQSIDAEWPRTASQGDEKVSMYQPQLETWQGDEIKA